MGRLSIWTQFTTEIACPSPCGQKRRHGCKVTFSTHRFQQFQWFTGCLQVYRYIKIQHFSIRFLFRYLPKLTGASMANTPPDMSNSSNSIGTWSECPTQRLQLQNSKGKCFGSFLRCVQLNVTSIKMPPGNTWKNFPHGQYVEPRLDVACSATMLLEAGSPRRQL